MTQATGAGSVDSPGGASGTDPNNANSGTDPNSGAQGGANDGQTGQLPQQQGKTAEQLQAELQQTIQRMQAADRNNAALQQKLKQLEDANLSEQEKLKRDHAQATQQVEQLNNTVKELKLQVAFVNDNTYKWHNPQAALKLADLSGVEVGDDGSVKGLKEALKAVADANPWMVKTDDSGEGGNHNDKDDGPTGSTGASMNGGGKQHDDRSVLTKKFPGLRSRVTG